MNEDKMKLWDSVCESDPTTTKRVNQRGGFTAVCAQSQLKRATELWGSYGGEWGVKDCAWGLIHDKDGEVVEITLHSTFYYPNGSFELGTDIAYRAGGDSRKKLLTDLTTKALSKLGFNADIFEGKFDDNKYVAEMTTKFADPRKKKADKAAGELDYKALCKKLPIMNEEEGKMLDGIYELIKGDRGSDYKWEVAVKTYNILGRKWPSSQDDQEKVIDKISPAEAK